MKTTTTTDLIVIPPLDLSTRGEVLHSNAELHVERLKEWISTLLDDPATDAEFGRVEQDIKLLKEEEVTLVTAKERVIESMEDLNKLFTLIDDGTETARQARLYRERMIKSQKDLLKDIRVRNAIGDLICEERLAEKLFGEAVRNAIKGKRTLDSIDDCLKVIIGSINATITASRKLILSKVKTHGEWIAPDADTLECKNPDVVEAELRRRFESKRAEDQRRELEAEAAKARAEAAAAIQNAQKAQAAPTPQITPQTQPEPIVCKVDLATDMTITEDQEWELVAQIVRKLAAELKPFKTSLNSERNQRRFAAFIPSVNQGWTNALAIK